MKIGQGEGKTRISRGSQHNDRAGSQVERKLGKRQQTKHATTKSTDAGLGAIKTMARGTKKFRSQKPMRQARRDLPGRDALKEEEHWKC